MADENTSPDDLISELEAAAQDFEPVGAAAFAAEARDELAAYREQRFVRRGEQQSFERKELEFRGPAFAIPERYQSRAEIFVVFETFVRAFVDPALVTAQIPGLLAQIDPDRLVTRIAFRRFGEEEAAPMYAPANAELSRESRELLSMAEELGLALFGDYFRGTDFWAPNV